MSGTSSAPVPTFTISIGSPSVFTNDSSIDVGQQVNADIAAAPVGDKIDLIFNPGTYGVGSTILLPSNTSVTGNYATLQYLPGNGGTTFSGPLMANADSHAISGAPMMQTNLVNGTTIAFPDWNWQNTVCESMSGSIPAIVDTNISIQGLTFSVGSGGVFGDWITNATNIDVQDNTYIGGGDGTAFVNVVNGVVANNLAVGQNNASYDNWDGPNNITVEDNQSYMGATGWSVLMNSTPSGDPNNPGDAVNDGIVDNLFSSGTNGDTAVNANALESYGFTTENLIVQQGNIDSTNGLPNATAVYSGNPQQNLIIENDITSGLNDTITSQNSDGIVVLANASTGNSVTTDTSVVGNLAQGVFSDQAAGVINNTGNDPTTINNLEVGQGAGPSGITTDALEGGSSQAGNTEISGSAVSGTPVKPSYDIKAPATVFLAPGLSQSLTGLAIDDQNLADTVSVTLLSHFGTFSLPASTLMSQAETVNGESGFVITGSANELNTILNGISFASDAAGWDDSVELILTMDSAIVADRYVPVIELSGTETDASLITLSSSELSTMGLRPDVQNGTTYGPQFSGSSAVLAPSGDNNIAMNGSIGLVFLGSGDNTVSGGSNVGYITTGDGSSHINLFEGGNITIAGGPGTMGVNAATGNNLIQSGAGDATIVSGSGINTILAGLGNTTVFGQAGDVLIESLPQDGGTLNASLGSGGGTIYALSGNATISTDSFASDLIYLGLGQDSVKSAGDDIIHTGAGEATIDASGGGTDNIFGGTGQLCFIGGANPAVIDPAMSSTLVANGGDMTVASGGSFSLTIDPTSTGHRVILLPGLSDGVTLSGYMRHSITAETVSGGILSIDLVDGTTIDIPHIMGQCVRLVEVPNAIAAGAFNVSSLQPHATLWKFGLVSESPPGGGPLLSQLNSLNQINQTASSI